VRRRPPHDVHRDAQGEQVARAGRRGRRQRAVCRTVGDEETPASRRPGAPEPPAAARSAPRTSVAPRSPGRAGERGQVDGPGVAGEAPALDGGLVGERLQPWPARGDEARRRLDPRLAPGLDREVHRARSVHQHRQPVAHPRGLDHPQGRLGEEEERGQRGDGAQRDQANSARNRLAAQPLHASTTDASAASAAAASTQRGQGARKARRQDSWIGGRS